MKDHPVQKALEQSLDALALRVTTSRGGYQRGGQHETIPSSIEDIERLAASIHVRLAPLPSDIEQGRAHRLYEAIRPLMAYGAEPPEYPGLALIPQVDLERLRAQWSRQPDTQEAEE